MTCISTLIVVFGVIIVTLLCVVTSPAAADEEPASPFLVEEPESDNARIERERALEREAAEARARAGPGKTKQSGQENTQQTPGGGWMRTTTLVSGHPPSKRTFVSFIAGGRGAASTDPALVRFTEVRTRQPSAFSLVYTLEAPQARLKTEYVYEKRGGSIVRDGLVSTKAQANEMKAELKRIATEIEGVELPKFLRLFTGFTEELLSLITPLSPRPTRRL